MAKALKPTVPLTGRVGGPIQTADPTQLADNQTMIQVVLQECNAAMAAIVGAQMLIRKDITLGTADVARVRYQRLDRLRRHVLQQRHQIQVTSFTLDGWTAERLTQRLAAIMAPLDL